LGFFGTSPGSVGLGDSYQCTISGEAQYIGTSSTNTGIYFNAQGNSISGTPTLIFSPGLYTTSAGQKIVWVMQLTLTISNTLHVQALFSWQDPNFSVNYGLQVGDTFMNNNFFGQSSLSFDILMTETSGVGSPYMDVRSCILTRLY